MNDSLPIHSIARQALDALAAYPALVLVAPTGSGKTTQMPQLLHHAGLIPPNKRIVVLQPRRVAARSVAARVTHEMDVTLGGLVGYQVRFDERIGPETRIAFVTEGIFLRWLQRDPSLADIGAVLFDEFHERNLLSDIALALCKALQAQSRPDLKLLVMSATLEAEQVARYLGCPVLESQGRSFPVTVHYQAWDDDAPVAERAAQRTLDLLRSTTEGDILVFMPGMGEIQATLDELRQGVRGMPQPPALLMLHGDLAPREQDRVFAPSEYRRVIVATNVAETSITIPNIRYVVDSGQARIARYDPARGLNTLRIEPISQASADQRAGRAGRVVAGDCYRLWSEKSQAARPARNTPEIQRGELASALLQIHAFGVRDVERFDFLDKPDAGRVAIAARLLRTLNAVTADGVLTPAGERMLAIPTHPRYARMLIEAERHGCVREVALLAAMVGGRDLLLRINPRDERDRILKRNRAGLIKRHHELSDYFLLANSFKFAESVTFDGKQCFTHGINSHVAREVAQAFEQMLGVCEECGLPTAPFVGDDAALAQAIALCHLVGFVDHLAVRTSGGSSEYDLAGGRRCELNDDSIVRSAMLVVASEIREINARNGAQFTLLNVVSAVKAEWVRALHPPGLEMRLEHVFDRLRKQVVAGRVLRYHDLLIGGEPTDEVDPAIAARMLAEEYADELHRVPGGDRFLQRHKGLAQAALVDLLAEAWSGARSWADIQKRPL